MHSLAVMLRNQVTLIKMKIFLKFKPWQLFTIWIITSIIFFITMRTMFWWITFELYAFSIVGWMYSIGKYFNKLNDKKAIVNYGEDIWFILYLICGIPFGYYFANFGHDTSNDLILKISGLIGFVSMIRLANFSAKAYKQYNNNKDLKFSDYLEEFIWITIFIVGIWRIQPEINKIIDKK